MAAGLPQGFTEAVDQMERARHRTAALEFGIGQIAEFDRHQVAVHAQHRRHADRQMDVGTALGETQFQERVDAWHGC